MHSHHHLGGYHHQTEYFHHQSQPAAPQHTAPPQPTVIGNSQQHSYAPHGTDLIGRPIHFTSGQFAGQTIRAELHEIQKADLGRKYARVDRRPLDPPPVVQLRLFHVYNPGTERETEKEIRNYEEVQVLGLVCTVDLFPVPGPGHPDPDSPGKASASSPPQTTFPASLSSQYTLDHKYSNGYTFVGPPLFSMSDSGVATLAVPAPPQPIPGYLPLSRNAPDIVHRLGDFEIAESTKATGALVGATFIQPACVEYQGNKSLVFVFADLAVKIEGTFILRYRVFDIFSRPYTNLDVLSIQAECYGGSFRVYSTKEFPGLQASTELTKQLARWGVRLNIRETERRRRKKNEMRNGSPPSSAGYTTTKSLKRKHVTSPGSVEYASDDD